MNTAHYTPHIFSLCVLSVLGNAIISMPFYKSGGFLLVLFSAVLSLALILFINLLTKWGTKNKIVFYFAAAVVCATAIYSAVTTFLDYYHFLKSVQMPQTSVYLLSAVLVFVVVFFALSSTSAFYKYSLLVAFIGVILIAICFVGGIKNFNVSGFTASFSKPVFNIKDFWRCFSATAVIFFFVSLKTKKFSAKPLVLGTAAGFLIVALCFAQSVLTLGLANDISYPYLKAVSIISSGSLFTRIDGFVYFLFFITALVKVTVCVKTVYLIIKKLTKLT